MRNGIRGKAPEVSPRPPALFGIPWRYVAAALFIAVVAGAIALILGSVR